MSYLVFALGALLSLFGAFAIIAGYEGIIQVERGWAGVIAGATALSGGIMTIALGFILHSLSGLHALLNPGKRLTPPRELGEDEAGELGPEPGLAKNPEAAMAEAGPPPAATPSAAVAPAASLRTWPQRPTRFSLAPARTVLKSRGTVLPAARGTRESDLALPKPPPISRDALRGPEAAPEPPFEPGFGSMPAGAAAKAGDAADTRPASAPSDETPADPAWNADGEPGLFDEDKANEPPIEASFPEMPFDHRESGTELRPRVTWPAGTESIEAILGEGFRIEPDPEPAAGKPSTERSPEAIELASRDAAPPLSSEAVPAGDPEASPKPSAPAAPYASEEGLAIVGRYDSEGTAYVMYGDGSIEARTEHAVLHFKSMVELKTFMESRAQTPQE